jgi:hypothetical protein
MADLKPVGGDVRSGIVITKKTSGTIKGQEWSFGFNN